MEQPSSTNETLDFIAQLQLYLIQEYSPQSWLEVSRESYLHYRNYAIALKPKPHLAAHKDKELMTPREEIPLKKQTPLPNVNSEVKPLAPVPKYEPTPSALKKSEPLPKTVIVKEEPLAKTPDDFADIRKSLAEHFPHQIIIPQTPDDASAKAIKNGWKNKSKHGMFLENLCKALWVIYGVKATVHENKLRWGESSQQVVELKDPIEYFRNPQLKSILWNEITNMHL